MTKNTWLLILLLPFILAASPARGDNSLQQSWQLTPFVGFSLFENTQGIKNSPLYGIELGRNLDEHWTFEGALSYLGSETEHSPHSDLELYQLAASLVYHFQPTQRLVPYLLGGVGGFYIDADRGGSETGTLIQYGAGLRYALNPTLAIRGEIRHQIFFDLPDENGKERTCNALTTLVGLQLRFADAPEAAVTAFPRPQAKSAQPAVAAGGAILLPGPLNDAELGAVAASHSATTIAPATLSVAPKFDSGNVQIRSWAPQDLKNLKAFLEDQPNSHILIMGEDDENTLSFTRYKLQEHRAHRVRLFLIESFGVEPKRVETMSQRNWMRIENETRTNLRVIRFAPMEKSNLAANSIR
jgi:OmpA-OmpF porin, OOP family